MQKPTKFQPVLDFSHTVVDETQIFYNNFFAKQPCYLKTKSVLFKPDYDAWTLQAYEKMNLIDRPQLYNFSNHFTRAAIAATFRPLKWGHIDYMI